ncbi:MAG TPA: hypothetical protein VFE42_33470 [Chloroflexota bacterium]|nr:hypothetical protein [Chloroflexota bacterium]
MAPRSTRWPDGSRGESRRKCSEECATCQTYHGRPHILSVVRDISAQVEAEERLREQEEQYRDIFEATGDGLVIADLNGITVVPGIVSSSPPNMARRRMHRCR